MFGKFIYIKNGFSQGFTQGQGGFVFALKGFTNPPTIKKTDSFKVDIFYTEASDLVSSYEGDALKLTCVPSSLIDLKVGMFSDKHDGNTTGYLN